MNNHTSASPASNDSCSAAVAAAIPSPARAAGLRKWPLRAVLTGGLLLACSASAQFAPHVVLSGLDNPRGLAFGGDGALYITEAGSVGTPGADTPFVTVRGSSLFYGESGAITRWDGSSESQVVSGLPMLYNPTTAEVTGAHGIGLNSAGDIYFTTGLGTDPEQRTGPELNRLGQLMRLPAGSSTPEVVADVADFESTNNPAGGPVDSNPFKLKVHEGGVLVADAGANAILNVGFDGEIDVVATLTALPPGIDAVPTSLALSETGDIFVSQLTGFPFPVGGAGVFRVEDAGLSLVGGGFTNVIDLAYGPDGMLYVLEFAHFGLLSGDPTGGLWRLDPTTGLSTLLMTDGLIAPTALTFDDEGILYVANRGVIPGSGEILRFQPVPEPAVTGLAAAVGLVGVLLWRRRAKAAQNAAAAAPAIGS